MVRPFLLAVALAAAAAAIGCGASRSNASVDGGRSGGSTGASEPAVASGGLSVGGLGGIGGTSGIVGAGGVGSTSGAAAAGPAGATADAGASEPVAGTSGSNGVSGAGGASGGPGVSGAGGASGGPGVSGAGGASGGPGVSGAGGASGGPGVSGAAGDGGTAGDIGTFYPLDMNDVTILVPLPASTATPVVLRGNDLADDGTVLVPRALVDRLDADADFGQPILPPQAYERLHVVAVRFDLCDRHLPGPCPEDEDGRLRLVFQPIADGQGADDVGFHAFYAIPNHEIPGAVAAMRDLARIATSQSGPLRVSPALGAADPSAYAAKLRAVVKRYGGEARIVRLTMNARSRISAQVQWVLRGAEKEGDAFGDIAIPGATAILETVALGGDPSFDIMPVTDTPAGFLDAMRSWIFDGADETKQRGALASLAAIESPLSHTAETVACAGCHVSTVIMKARATSSGMDPMMLPGRYTSRFDLSVVGGKSAETRVTIRALGYLAKDPMISQRVVNDTAQTLTEIEHRFPAR
jgi:hypothetical protein